MEKLWARYVEPSGQPGPDYWSYLAERLVDLATIPEGAALLDIGTFDGNVLFKAIKKAGPHAQGIGIDLYPGSLQDGITKAIKCGSGNVAFAQMDAACLGLAPERYDSVLANFIGWEHCFDFERMEFTAPDSRMAEIKRVLKPGGQVGIGFWIGQRDIDWIVEAFRRCLPKCEDATGKRITCYEKENPKGYETILRNEGFQKIGIHVETTAFVSPDTASWWRQMKQAAREYFEEMPELERFKEQILADLRPFQSPMGIQFDKAVGYAFGCKP